MILLPKKVLGSRGITFIFSPRIAELMAMLLIVYTFQFLSLTALAFKLVEIMILFLIGMVRLIVLIRLPDVVYSLFLIAALVVAVIELTNTYLDGCACVYED